MKSSYRDYKNLNKCVLNILAEKAEATFNLISAENQNLSPILATPFPPPTNFPQSPWPKEKEIEEMEDSGVLESIESYIEELIDNILNDMAGGNAELLRMLILSLIAYLVSQGVSIYDITTDFLTAIADFFVEGFDPLDEMLESLAAVLGIVGASGISALQTLLIFGGVIGIALGIGIGQNIMGPWPNPFNDNVTYGMSPNGPYNMLNGFGWVVNQNNPNAPLTDQQIQFMEDNPADFIEVPPGSGVWWACPGCMVDGNPTSGNFMNIPGFNPNDPAYGYISNFQDLIRQSQSVMPAFLPAYSPNLPPGLPTGSQNTSHGSIYVTPDGQQFIFLVPVPGTNVAGFVRIG